MAGVDMKTRGKLVEEYARVLLDAWTGEPFEWRGRTITVTPKPFTQPHPDPAHRRRHRVGGAARGPSAPADDADEHRSAAPGLVRRRGREVGLHRRLRDEARGSDVHLRDRRIPSRPGPRSGRTCCTRRRPTPGSRPRARCRLPKIDAETIDDLKQSAQYVVGTPDDVIAAAERIPATGAMTFNPLAGGLPPDLSWPSLELFASDVLPRIRPPAG